MGIGKEIAAKEAINRPRKVFIDTAEDMGIRRGEAVRDADVKKVFADSAKDLGIGVERVARKDAALMPAEPGIQMEDVSSRVATPKRGISGSGGKNSGKKGFVDDFTRTPLSGQATPGGNYHPMGRNPSDADITDVAVVARSARDADLQINKRKTEAKTARDEARRKEWEGEMNRLIDERQKQEELVADLLKKKQEVGAKLIAAANEQKGGMMSNKDFQDEIGRLDRDYQREKAKLDRMISKIKDHGNGQGGPGIGPGSGGGGSGIGPNVRNAANCNSETHPGGNRREVIPIKVGFVSGTAIFHYETYGVKDRMILEYGGGVLFDTNCTNTSQKGVDVPITLTGASDTVTVTVHPSCAGKSGTSWKFTLNCPN
jgi:hypothetical protein